MVFKGLDMNYLGVFGVWNNDLGIIPSLQNMLPLANTNQAKFPGEGN